MAFFMLPCAALLISACRPSIDDSGAQWYARLHQAHTEIDGDQLSIISGLDLELSPDADQALHQGIPLSLTVDTRIARHRGFWAWLVEEQRQVWRISYLPLSRQYVLTGPQGERNTFSRLRHLRAALREPHRFTLPWPRRTEPGVAKIGYQVQIRTQIDLQSLPSPLRLPALFSPQWHMRSDWQTWQLATD